MDNAKLAHHLSSYKNIRHKPIAPSVGRTESLRRGLSGMDAARAAMGQGWPFAAGPRSDDGVREVERSETRMQGQRPFGSFWGVCQKGLAVRAKPDNQATNRRRRSAIAWISVRKVHKLWCLGNRIANKFAPTGGALAAGYELAVFSIRLRSWPCT
jgi:hypothetical protein